MTPILTLLSPSPYIELSLSLAGWLGFAALFGVIVGMLWKWRRYNRPFERRTRLLFLGLALSTVIASLFLGIQLPSGKSLPPPGTYQDISSPVVMLFSALPWVLAAGMLGPTPAAGIALLSGAWSALWNTHNPYTLLVVPLLAVLLSAALRQPYRTRTFRLLRHPLISAIMLMLIFPAIHVATILATTRGMLVSRVDYAFTTFPGTALATSIELLIAALVAEGMKRSMPAYWIETSRLEPSPAEKSLQTRFLTYIGPLAILLVIGLMVGDWYVAGNAAHTMLRGRMENAAGIAAENIPYFLEAGQSQIQYLALDPRLTSSNLAVISAALEEDIKRIPFFTQLIVLDPAGKPIASYPDAAFTGNQTPADEQLGIQKALTVGIPFQTFTVPPADENGTAQISFVTTLYDQQQKIRGALIGRSDLGANPFTKPILASLNNLSGISGQGLLIDQDGVILAHTDPTQVMKTYLGQTSDQPLFYQGAAPDGTRQLVYYQTAQGRPWAIALLVPARSAQTLALSLVGPLLGIIVILSAIAIMLSRVGLRLITSSLQNLSSEAGRLAQGQLDVPLSVVGEDEIGHLRRAFEQMRASLKARLDELNRLLVVSQGVASSLEISEAVQPALESALLTGANMARVVLAPAVVPELDGDSSSPISFATGPGQNLYHELDEQILALTRQQERLVLPNLTRPRLLNLTPGLPRPDSIFAIALRHENSYYGTLWLSYEQPHAFSEEQVRFLVTLGGLAALAAANARLFQNAEIGRQRLAAILASSPDPVLVTDQHDRLLLANPAAWQVLGLGSDIGDGKPIEQVVSQHELLEMLRSSSAEKQSREVVLPDGRVFMGTATPVLAEGQRMGRVCVLRDVTHFKELDALKSDFVNTVSHDLRSPLTLMRGYATMLEMVGQLNEQQVGYVRKIVTGVESMSRLVNNLLDLGRIDAGVGLQLEMIPIQDVVEHVVGALQLQAAQKRIQLTNEIAQQTIPLIEADQALLQQALHNLVENAIKYTRPEGKVHVRLSVKPSGMFFEVRDNGIGISPVDMPRLFEKFYRGVQPGSKDQRGTGLGLAIVKSIAERHGGRVWAESQLGKGSAFYLSIPLRQPKRDSSM